MFSGYIISIIAGHVHNFDLRYTNNDKPFLKVKIKSIKENTFPNAKNKFYNSFNKVIVWGKNAEILARKIKKSTDDKEGTYIVFLCKDSGEMISDNGSYHRFVGTKYKIYDNSQDFNKLIEKIEKEDILNIKEIFN